MDEGDGSTVKLESSFQARMNSDAGILTGLGLRQLLLALRLCERVWRS